MSTYIKHTHKLKLSEKISKVSTFDRAKDYLSIMPLSIDEATRRYESYVQNIQDSIFTLESFMGSELSFTFDMAQALGNLDQVDTMKEEKAVSLQIQSLEEYKKIITNEKKRRALAKVIEGKVKVSQLMEMKNKRRNQRVAFNNPYSRKKGERPTEEKSDVLMSDEKLIE